MKAWIISFRRGGNRQYQNQVILEIDGVRSKGEACKLIGRKVVWQNPLSGDRFIGKIIRAHGNKGRVIARFRKTLPGQAVGTSVALA